MVVDPLPGHEDVLLRVDALQVEPAVALEQTFSAAGGEGGEDVGGSTKPILGLSKGY